jgi:hypothetical protein
MSVKVSLDARTLDRALSSLVEGALREIGATLVDIADDAEANAEDKWYTQVRRRTGRTGTALDTELRAKQEQLQAVVLSRNKASYVVRRPGPLSVVTQLLSASEYAEAMSQYRRTGALPPDVKVQKVNSNGQPIGLYRTRRNPLASDGKVLWQELVRKEGRKIVLARVRDVDAALQRAANHMSRG